MRSPLLLALALLLLTPPLAADGPPWTPLGPGGGPVHDLAIDPVRPSVLYVATGNRAYKSVNAGASWTPIAGIDRVFRIVLDPSRPTTVYAVAGDRVFKSLNGGATWAPTAPLGLPSSIHPGDLVADPTQPSRLYVGLGLGGVLRSDDGGASWRLVSQGIGGGAARRVTELAVPRRPAGTVLAGTAGLGVYRTINAGESWKPSRRGMPAEGVADLAVAPSDPRIVYASLESGVFRSTDGGVTWRRVGLPGPGEFIGALAVHPRSPRTVYGSAPGGVFRSTDGGETWARLGLSAGVATFAIDSRNPDTIYGGSFPQSLHGGGVLRSVDGGAHWTPRNRGLYELETTAVAAGPDTLLAGTPGQGVFRLADPGGPLWARASAGLPPGFGGIHIEEIVQVDGGFFFVRTFPDSSLWRSADAGRSWTQTLTLESRFITVAADPGVAGSAYAVAREGFFHTTDGGASWTLLSERFTGCFPWALAVAPSSPPGARVIYAGGSQPVGSSCSFVRGLLVRSPDGGATWIDASAGLPALIVAMAVDPLDAGVVYAGMNTGSTGVWKSTDGGATWTRPGDLPFFIHELVASPIPGRLYAVTRDFWRIFRSDDGGATWQPWDDGIRADRVNGLTIDPQDPARLYAATSSGVWTLAEED
ncbi:MAG TPA: hypothetical protein VG477_14930 [Thermoanaerobaculia bacterium]|nr:hypothetical protein [Thermoanaerobaculia bacterium]